jgi:hypothetical protein
MQIGRSNQSKGNDDTRNLHRPADVWVHPQTNELFVADGYGNHRVVVFDAETGAFKRMWGAFGNKPMDDDHCEVVTPTSFSDPGPQQLSIAHAIRVAKDGTVYVADREYRRVQMFTSGGKWRFHSRSQDARDFRQRPAYRHDWGGPPDRDRFERQSLYCADRRRHAEADIQGDVEVSRGVTSLAVRRARLQADLVTPRRT